MKAVASALAVLGIVAITALLLTSADTSDIMLGATSKQANHYIAVGEEIQFLRTDIGNTLGDSFLRNKFLKQYTMHEILYCPNKAFASRYALEPGFWDLEKIEKSLDGETSLYPSSVAHEILLRTLASVRVTCQTAGTHLEDRIMYGRPSRLDDLNQAVI